jgi:Predicted AAA-ATPase/PD-(D/E)XK nuclease superfamily
MEALKNMPIGVQDFEKLRNGDYLYVDKTALIYQLVSTGSYYFLSRPRRFGKSMLLSTLHAYFSGKKELFEGLAIEKLEKDWIKYPVFHLDLNTENYSDADALYNKLSANLNEWEHLYGKVDYEKSLGTRFEGVIRRAYEATGQRVVILVDEYDKPVLQAIGDDEQQETYRSILKGFYGALKSMDRCIQFAFLTGVTKFGKVSVFSDLNNLYDISMDGVYASVCGITDEELDSVFIPYIKRLAFSMHRPYDDVREVLRTNYNGYHFCENSVGIYNPFSILCTFQSNKIRNYWFETGTPSYLVYLLKKHDYNLEHMSTVECDADVLNSIDSQSTNPIPVIYQSGYLTIKDFDPEFGLYTLGFPNREVEDGFLKYLLPYYASIDKTQTAFFITNFVKDIRAGKVDEFFKRLSSLFADTPYEQIKDLENHYQNVLFIVTKLMGLYVKAEYHTSEGRIDLVLQTNDYTYIMEFKLNGTAEEALAQINDKNYALPFTADNRKLIKIGVNFSSKNRNIDRWIIE